MPSGHAIAGGIQELYYGVTHLPSSFRQYFEKDPVKAQAFLLAAQASLPDKNPFCTKNEFLAAEPLGSGFSASAHTFLSDSGKWVIKIGAEKSPMRGPDPSSQAFTVLYASALDIQREVYGEELPHLIVGPQAILHLQTREYGGTTVVLEPFIDAMPLQAMHSLPQEDQDRLQQELRTFKRLSTAMEKKYGIQFDFWHLDFWRKEIDIVIGLLDGERHIVFLDNGPFVRELTPLFYEANKLFGNRRLKGY